MIKCRSQESGVRSQNLFCLLPSVFCLLMSSGCILNNPYRATERNQNVYYTTFAEPPKTLDPAVTYTSDAYAIINLIYEMPFQYHYLKRPYELVPNAAVAVPKPKYFNRSGERLGRDPAVKDVALAVYEITIKPGIMYEDHPAFAKDAHGQLMYHRLTKKDVKGMKEIHDFPKRGTRELTAEDFVYQVKRLADPQLHCPILATMEKYMLDMSLYAASMQKELAMERERRKEAQGHLYSQEQDEKSHPIKLDMDRYPLRGVRFVSKYKYQITLSTKYPQILYWLAMPFFCPIPKDVADFYRQAPLVERNITLDRFPVGTGPYQMAMYRPNHQIVLERNPRFHGETYPSEGEGEDSKKNLLADAGKPLPFIDRMVMKQEKEALPTWNKFLQGYYDSSGIPSDSFDTAVQFSPEGEAGLTPFLNERRIRLETAVQASTSYMGFNMDDSVVGGYTEEKRKLRQAISIALDMEERIEIFVNGRGIPAQDILAPGIYGYEPGENSINHFVYDWNKTQGMPVRKSLDEAKRLLTEAGYPGGKDKNGKQLTIGFDNAWTTAGAAPLIQWFMKKFDALGIRLEPRTTDYNRFQEKMQKGNFQFFSWGWNADYPDPENFMFLLYGPNSTVKYHGENHSNYASPEFDRLFKRMESMENGPERLNIIREMKKIMQRDAPLVWGYHPVGFSLFHSWLFNNKPNSMANNTFKYQRLNPAAREQYREKWNQPVWWPLSIVGGVAVGSVALAVWTVRRREELL